MKFCDLHMHSTASDGTFHPAQLATHAAQVGLSAIALTDHDTTAGLVECAHACTQAGVEFVPGIELSADPKPLRLPWVGQTDPNAVRKWGTLHILGFFVRHDDPGLHALHLRIQGARESRNPEIVRNLQLLGIDIEYREVEELAVSSQTDVIGRPHIAQVLVNKGVVGSVSEAFHRFIGEGKPAFARRDLIGSGEAIRAIHAAGGLAILAHPIQLKYQDDAELEHIVATLQSQGLDGMEVRHSNHTPELVAQYTALAHRLGLATSGGSDFHGTRKTIAMGSQAVPMEELGKLRQIRTRAAATATPTI